MPIFWKYMIWAAGSALSWAALIVTLAFATALFFKVFQWSMSL